MKSIILYLGAILIALVVTSCATIIHGNMQLIRIDSNPTGAIVFIDGIEYDITPAFVILSSRGHTKGESKLKKKYHVTIYLEGYYTYETEIKRKVDGWFFGSLAIPIVDIFGIIIDIATGSMYKLKPDQINAYLEKEFLQTKHTDNALFITTSLHANPE